MINFNPQQFSTFKYYYKKSRLGTKNTNTLTYMNQHTIKPKNYYKINELCFVPLKGRLDFKSLSIIFVLTIFKIVELKRKKMIKNSW